jgi:hypothetical protein
MMTSVAPWLQFALGSSFFAGLTAILGKLGVAGLNSNLATLIRTVVIFVVTAGIVTMRDEWQMPKAMATRPVFFLVLSGVATGLSWPCYFRALQLAPAFAGRPDRQTQRCVRHRARDRCAGRAADVACGYWRGADRGRCVVIATS